MPGRRAPLRPPRRGRLGRRLVVAPAVAVLALAVAGCSGDGGEEPTGGATRPTTVAPTPLAEVPTTELTVARADFCAQVAPDAVTAALGAGPTRSQRWRNGQRTELAAGVADVAHEFGCRWSSAGGATAAAWVFAPPVTAAEAGRLRADAVRAPGCRTVAGVPRFGRPTVAVTCTAHGASSVTLQGLFGDAWLSCSLGRSTRRGAAASDASGLVDRAEAWCVSVALAAAA